MQIRCYQKHYHWLTNKNLTDTCIRITITEQDCFLQMYILVLPETILASCFHSNMYPVFIEQSSIATYILSYTGNNFSIIFTISTCILYLSNKASFKLQIRVYISQYIVTCCKSMAYSLICITYCSPIVYIVMVGTHFICNKIMGVNRQIRHITLANDNLWLFIAFQEQKYENYFHWATVLFVYSNNTEK